MSFSVLSMGLDSKLIHGNVLARVLSFIEYRGANPRAAWRTGSKLWTEAQKLRTQNPGWV